MQLPYSTTMNHNPDISSSSCTSFDSVSAAPDLASFAYTLFSTLTESSSNETNVLISPFSIASALALILAGATIDSLCQTQLLTVLGIQSHTDIPLLSKLLLSSPKESSGVELSIANGIWTGSTSSSSSSSIKESFVEIVQKDHNAIADALPKTYDPINKYVSDKTGGLIQDLLTGEVDPLTVAVLVNAVYFKGSWKEQFKQTATSTGTFHAIGKNNEIISRDAKMMKSTRFTHFGKNIDDLGGAHCVLLEYGEEEDDNNEESEFGALFFLPKDKTQQSMQSMISNITNFMTSSSSSSTTTNSKRPIHHLLENNLMRRKVALTIPRFKISYGVKELKSDLQSIGIKEAFNQNGKDLFNEMSNDPLVHLDEVYHKAVMEVTEEGTVAAAATAGVMMTRSLPKPPPELVFDRPFVMIVVHMETGLPLFMTKVDDPDLMF